MSAEILELAEAIAGDTTNILDKVIAVTQYLRKNYAYEDSVDIPRDANPIEWFLFEGKSGFCNYFASTEVLLLRALGIPSRLVVGYAQGESTNNGQTFNIEIRDSHAWVEVYFPDHGWVLFEPTPNQPDFAFGEDNAERETEIALEVSGQDETIQMGEDGQDPRAGSHSNMPEDIEVIDRTQSQLRKVLVWSSTAALVIIVIFAFVRGIFFQARRNEIPIFLRKRLEAREAKIPRWLDNWADYEVLGPVEKMYGKLKRYSRWVLSTEVKAETPREFLLRLAFEVGLDEKQIRAFMEQFHQEVYSQADSHAWRESDIVYRLFLKAIARKFWRNFIERFGKIRQSILHRF